LTGQEPIHGVVEVVFVDGVEAEELAEGVVTGLAAQGAAGGELGTGLEDMRAAMRDRAARRRREFLGSSVAGKPRRSRTARTAAT
jgi:hypothetical protein